MSHATSADSVEEALRRAAVHARTAVAETIAALRALLDAVALVATNGPAKSSDGLASLARIHDEHEEQIAPTNETTRPASAALLSALAEALDEEIARWEQRARRDPEARAVLRAFLGLRELLWEMGVRPEQQTPPEPARDADEPPRVQRVQVHG